jgi:hypothetical protein
VNSSDALPDLLEPLCVPETRPTTVTCGFAANHCPA